MPPKVRLQRAAAILSNHDTGNEDESMLASSLSSTTGTVTDNCNGSKHNSEDPNISSMPNKPDSRSPNAEPEASLKSSAMAGSPLDRQAQLSNATIPPHRESRPAALKYKPKSSMRRSKEERDAVERAEAERMTARQAAERASSTQGSNLSRGRGRGRGFDAVNRWRDQRLNVSHGASGHLGGRTLEEVTKRGRGRGGGGRGVSSKDEGYSEPFTMAEATQSIKREPAVKPEKDKDGDTIMKSSTSGSNRKRAGIKREDRAPTYISSEGELDSDGAARVDIERINLITDDEDTDSEMPPKSEVAIGKQRQQDVHIRHDHLRPVRIQRQEHMERAVGVNTDASSLTSAELRRKAKERIEAGGSLFLPKAEDVGALLASNTKGKRKQRDIELVREERKWKGVYQDEDDKDGIVKIKDEPEEEEHDAMVLDQTVPVEGPEPIAIDHDDAVPLSEAMKSPLAGLEDTARTDTEIKKSNQTFPDDMTEEIGQEYGKTDDNEDSDTDTLQIDEKRACLNLIKLFQDIKSLLDDCKVESPIPETATAAEDSPDDEFLDGDHGRAPYFDTEGSSIFQLPPLLPSLRDCTKVPTVSESKPPEAKRSSIQDSQTKSTLSSNPFATNPIKEEPDIKIDPDALVAANSIPNTYISGGFYSAGGCAGLLQVHKGGKMSAAWGGLDMEVWKRGLGKTVGMPQELVITKSASEVAKIEDNGEEKAKWVERVDAGKQGWGMGHLKGGFVCVPEMEALL